MPGAHVRRYLDACPVLYEYSVVREFMAQRGLVLNELSDRLYASLSGAGGVGYGEAVRRYAEKSYLQPRAAKVHLKRIVEGIERGELKDVSFYRRGRTRVFGNTDDKVFMDAKEAAEKSDEPDSYPSYVQLGGVYQSSPVRSEWTNCPVTGKITRATVITMGVADFMECPTCNWAHFLGVSPRMKDRRLYAWQVDPLVNALDYEDAISTGFIGDPKTFRRQPSRIPRVRKGGHYVGLWFRTSWDHDPEENLRRRGLLRRFRPPKAAARRTSSARSESPVRRRYRPGDRRRSPSPG